MFLVIPSRTPREAGAAAAVAAARALASQTEISCCGRSSRAAHRVLESLSSSSHEGTREMT